jgi:hypothetical protein
MNLGLIFDFVGIIILTLTVILDCPPQRVFREKKWWMKYWWDGWRPFYKITDLSGNVERKIKWDRTEVVYWIIPPKFIGHIVGFLFIAVGFVLQFLK